MANVFLNRTPRDIETALMLEKANILDIGNAVAYTDGTKVFVNTEDNLFKILPAYNHDFLKWLLWHERYHLELRHHNRFFKYLRDLDEDEPFHVTKEEVNIIMDILVHDSLSKLFPELVETARKNLAQMRNQNSLKYTFKTNTLEEMLKEYAKHKKEEDDEDGEGEPEEREGEGGEGEADMTSDSKSPDSKKDKDSEKKPKDGEGEPKDKPTERDDKDRKSKKGSPSDEAEKGKPDLRDRAKPEFKDRHDETDWSKLEEIEDKEFIDDDESDKYTRQINELKRKKIKLGRITETLNGLVTSARQRTYSKPNPIRVGGGIVLKGSTPGRAQLYLIFDASGSMNSQIKMFKDIISRSIPQAMETPCEWFAGEHAEIKPYKWVGGDGYYKGKFKDIMPVLADSGYSDDGDRTIELCYQAEQLGYTPIGVTDGGGKISWSKDKLKQLKRTILIGQNKEWLDEAKKINPRIQTLDV